VSAKIIQGDCLEVLRGMATESVDVVIADPPYMIGAAGVGVGKTSLWGDLCNGAFWFAAWYREVKRIVRPAGCFWTFLNWRTMPAVFKASLDADWHIESMLVWHKNWIGPGGHRGLRPSYEMVALLCGETFALTDRGLQDVQSFSWSGYKPSGHPAEKPVSLLKWLLQISVPAGSIVLDPFCGSGSTGEACKQLSMDFIGIELSEAYVEMSRKRLETDVTKEMFA